MYLPDTFVSNSFLSRAFSFSPSFVTLVEPSTPSLADEIFTTGNAQKVMPVTLFDQREFDYGPVCQRARELYWDYAHAAG